MLILRLAPTAIPGVTVPVSGSRVCSMAHFQKYEYDGSLANFCLNLVRSYLMFVLMEMQSNRYHCFELKITQCSYYRGSYIRQRSTLVSPELTERATTQDNEQFNHERDFPYGRTSTHLLFFILSPYLSFELVLRVVGFVNCARTCH